MEAGPVRAQDAVEQRPADIRREHPVVVRRRPGRVAEVPHAHPAGAVPQPVPHQPRDQAQVVILDQDPQAAGRRPVLAGLLGPGLGEQGVGEHLVVGEVGLPVAAEPGPELRLVGGVEKLVEQEPQGRVGHVVVGAAEDARRDVEHPHRDAVLVAVAAPLPGDHAVRVAERGADPGGADPGAERGQPVGNPGDHPAAAPAPGQRAVGAELVRDRAAVRRHEHALVHSPAG